MKNILLATTALVMSAGFASAEVTFSGTAEGGVTRTAAKKAVVAVAGKKADGTGSGTLGKWAYGTDKVLAFTAATTTVTNSDAADIAAAQNKYDEALGLLNVKIRARDAITTGQAAYNNANDDVVRQQSIVAQTAAILKTVSGTAAVAAVKAGDVTAYSGYDFNIGLSAASDNGITFAAGFDMGAGYLSDIANSELDLQSATIGTPAVSVSMNGYTVAFRQDNIDDLYDNDQNGDVSLAGTVGTVTFKIVHDLEEDVAAVSESWKYTAETDGATSNTSADATYIPGAFVHTAAKAAVYNTTSYTLGTTVGGVGLSLTGTDKNDEGLAAMKAKATYVMDALTFSLETNNRGDSTKKLNANKVSVAYAGEGVSASVSSNDDKDWDASATLTAGANSATFATDEESAWEAQVASDLGGGASVFGYVDSTELFMAGVRFKF